MRFFYGFGVIGFVGVLFCLGRKEPKEPTRGLRASSPRGRRNARGARFAASGSLCAGVSSHQGGSPDVIFKETSKESTRASTFLSFSPPISSFQALSSGKFTFLSRADRFRLLTNSRALLKSFKFSEIVFFAGFNHLTLVSPSQNVSEYTAGAVCDDFSHSVSAARKETQPEGSSTRDCPLDGANK